MYAPLSLAELNTLATIGNPDSCDAMPRTHLEKLYRLELIEPGRYGVALSRKGQEILVRIK